MRYQFQAHKIAPRSLAAGFASRISWAAAFLAILLLAFPAQSKPAPPPKKFIFFPGAPDPPRVQFLTSINSEKDVTGKTSSFQQFITGNKPADNGGLGKPYGIALSRGKFYVCDSMAHGIVIMDMAKHQFLPLQLPDEASVVEPLNITFDRDGSFYIVDDARNQVFSLDPKAQLRGVIGKKGAMKPRDAAVSNDRLFIADAQNHAVSVYDKRSRDQLFSIPTGNDATNMSSLLVLPTNLALDEKGRLYASDTIAGRVQVYDNAGKFIRSVGVFGDSPAAGTLKRPKGVAVNREGIIFVVDAVYQLVQMFDSEGRYLMCFGYSGDAPAGLILPAKVIVDYDHVGLFAKYAAPDFKVDHLLVVTSQFGNRKVSIYGFGHQK